MIKEFVEGHQEILSKENQEYIDEVKQRMDMEAGWTFLKRSSQLCKDMFVFSEFRGMGLSWKNIPWKQIPDWENQGNRDSRYS